MDRIILNNVEEAKRVSRRVNFENNSNWERTGLVFNPLNKKYSVSLIENRPASVNRVLNAHPGTSVYNEYNRGLRIIHNNERAAFNERNFETLQRNFNNLVHLTFEVRVYAVVSAEVVQHDFEITFALKRETAQTFSDKIYEYEKYYFDERHHYAGLVLYPEEYFYDDDDIYDNFYQRMINTVREQVDNTNYFNFATLVYFEFLNDRAVTRIREDVDINDNPTRNYETLVGVLPQNELIEDVITTYRLFGDDPEYLAAGVPYITPQMTIEEIVGIFETQKKSNYCKKKKMKLDEDEKKEMPLTIIYSKNIDNSIDYLKNDGMCVSHILKKYEINFTCAGMTIKQLQEFLKYKKISFKAYDLFGQLIVKHDAIKLVTKKKTGEQVEEKVEKTVSIIVHNGHAYMPSKYFINSHCHSNKKVITENVIKNTYCITHKSKKNKKPAKEYQSYEPKMMDMLKGNCVFDGDIKIIADLYLKMKNNEITKDKVILLEEFEKGNNENLLRDVVYEIAKIDESAIFEITKVFNDGAFETITGIKYNLGDCILNIEYDYSRFDEIYSKIITYMCNVFENTETVFTPEYFYLGEFSLNSESKDIINDLVSYIYKKYKCMPEIEKHSGQYITKVNYFNDKRFNITVYFSNNRLNYTLRDEIIKSIHKSHFTSEQMKIMTEYNTITVLNISNEIINTDVDKELDMKSSHWNSMKSLIHNMPIYEACDVVEKFDYLNDEIFNGGRYYVSIPCETCEEEDNTIINMDVEYDIPEEDLQNDGTTDWMRDEESRYYPIKSVRSIVIEEKVKTFNGKYKKFKLDTKGSKNFYEKYFPLKKPKFWCSSELCEYLLNEKIIKSSYIKYKFIPSRTYDIEKIKDIFKYFEDKLAEYLSGIDDEDERIKIKKEHYVFMMGSLGVYQKVFEKMVLSNNDEDAKLHSNTKHYTTGKFDNLISLKKKENVKVYENHIPLYQMIRDKEIIRLNEMRKLVGGTLKQVHTDSIVVSNPLIMSRPPNFDIHFVEKTMDDSKIERYNRTNFTYVPLTTDYITKLEQDKFIDDKLFYIPEKYNFIDVYNDNGSGIIKKMIDNGMSFLLTGAAGSGKTYNVREFVKLTGKKFICLAPTNAAATNFSDEAVTLYKEFILYFGKTTTEGGHVDFSEERKCEFSKKIAYSDIIIVDEVFLCSPSIIFPLVKLSIDMKKQIILIGSDKQLPNVESSDNPTNILTIQKLMNIVHYNHINLNHTFRYSMEDNETILKIIDGKIQLPIKNNSINRALCYFHKTEKRINMSESIKYINNNPSLKNTLINVNNTYAIYIAQGMPLICYKSFKKLGLINGMEYTLKDIFVENNKKTIVIYRNDKMDIDIILKDDEFGKYMNLAFCVTIYRSQGKTFDFPYYIADFQQICGTPNGLYVAITRTRNINTVYRCN